MADKRWFEKGIDQVLYCLILMFLIKKKFPYLNILLCLSHLHVFYLIEKFL